MKEVKRFKCDYCEKTTARASTMERHEKQCIKNPNCYNCYMCQHAYTGDYEDEFRDYYGKAVITTRKDIPQCAYHEEPLQECYGGSGNFAEKCHAYLRTEKICFDRDYEEASSDFKRNECDV